jgi:hypothetical protein
MAFRSGVVSLLVLLLGLFAHQTSAGAKVAQQTTGSVYWGASLYGKPPDSANFQPGGLFHKFENNIAKKPMSIIAWGAPWEYPTGTMLRFQSWYFENVRQHGAIPMLHWGSWACCGVIQSKYKLSNVARGDFDNFIRQWATDAKAWGYPFFLRFNWEMNGYWQFPWSVQLNGNTPADYVNAWRRVHNIFQQVGATNATWVWCPNISSSLTTPMAQVYPGSGYVDWLCLDGYNQYTRGAMPWLSFTQVFKGATSIVPTSKNSYQEITALAPDKPVMIGETGSIEYGDGGAKKGQWMRDMLADIPTQFPRIKALVYFNWNDNNPSLTWPIESSSGSQNGFSAGIQSSVYARNTFSNLPKYTKIRELGAQARVDTIGVYKAGKFYLRNSHSTGGADMVVTFGGDAADLPVAGDWNGDGVDTVGVYRSGRFFLSNSNTAPGVHYNFVFGNPGDQPFDGRWNSSMNHDGVGVFRPTNGMLYQKVNLTTGVSDYFAIYGNPGDSAFAGDWDGNGFDSIGVYRSSTRNWHLSNNGQPDGITYANTTYTWDIGPNMPIVGDWNGNAIPTTGVYSPSAGMFSLSNTLPPPGALTSFAFGPTWSRPIIGKWTAGSTPPQIDSNAVPPLSNIIVPNSGGGGALPDDTGSAD